ncbi:dynein light chain cytoplasmic [Zalerion maritima]|uniref:Dynein light chain n=1 Tax=Zalerion maritima TaxID=339359 RepID=A0AAD5WT79_9PEZI|nr:dynein light chain cytoplasmic [Zalerion maritima]
MAEQTQQRIAELEPQIKSADMTEEMQQEAIDVAKEAMTAHTVEKDIAQFIKRRFDESRGATWHCIVGRNFGSFVTHGKYPPCHSPAAVEPKLVL